MRNKDITPTEERKEQENETNEILLAEDAVQTTAYLANARTAVREPSSSAMFSECSARM